MATLGSLWVTIGAKTDGLKQGVAEATQQLETFEDKAKRAVKDGVGGAFEGLAASITPARIALAAVAGAAGLGVLVAKSMAAADALGSVAARLQTTPRDLGNLQYMAKVTSTDLDALSKAMLQSAQKSSEAAAGIGDSADAFKALRLNAAELRDLAPDEQMRRIGQALAGVENASDRARLTMDLFGKQGTEIIGFLTMGEEQMRAFAQEAERMNATLSAVDFQKIAAANSQIERSKSAFDGIANTITVELAPFIEMAAKALADWAVEADGFRHAIYAAIHVALDGVGFFLDIGNDALILLKSFKLGFEVIGVTAMSVFWAVTDVIATAMNGWLMSFNLMIDGVNAITGANFAKFGLIVNPFTKHMQNLGADIVKTAVEIDQMAGRPPSKRLTEWFEEVQAQATKTAETVVAAQDTVAAGAEIIDTKALEAAAKLREQLQQQFDQVETSLYTELEAENAAWAARLDIVGRAYNAKLITQQRFQAISEKVEAAHQAKLTAIENAAAEQRAKLEQQRLQNIATINETIFGNLATFMQTKSRDAFEVGKAAAIAEATVNTYLAGIKAYQAVVGIPVVGPGLAPIAAAAAVAAGINAISNIANTKFQGGNSGGKSPSRVSAGGATGAAVAYTPRETAVTEPSAVATPEQAGRAPAAAPAQAITITLEGDGKYSRQQIVELIAQINDAHKDGARLEVAA